MCFEALQQPSAFILLLCAPLMTLIKYCTFDGRVTGNSHSIDSGLLLEISIEVFVGFSVRLVGATVNHLKHQHTQTLSVIF